MSDLDEYSYILLGKEGSYRAYICYLVDNKNYKNKIYNSYTASKFFDLPINKVVPYNIYSPIGKSSNEGNITYHYQFSDYLFQVGILSDKIEIINNKIKKIKTAIKKKGFLVGNKPLQFRYWWTEFSERRAMNIISKWIKNIRSREDYKFRNKMNN
jgi:hypothetical protein